MRALFLCNALDSGAALYNIFNHLRNNFKTIVADVANRADAPKLLNKANVIYDTIIYDSAYCAALVNEHLQAPSRFNHVIFHHIHESPEQRQRKKVYIDKVSPDLIFVTFSQMKDEISSYGYRVEVVPFSFDTSRFKHLDYPSQFTIGYMGADMKHKGFDEVDQIAREMGVGCVSARRRSHEGGDYVGKEMEFYKQISCYVAAPSHESGPLPPIEAQLCGRPCVITPVGMMPYIFKYGAGGRLASLDNFKNAIDDVLVGFEVESRFAREFKLPDTTSTYEEHLLAIS